MTPYDQHSIDPHTPGVKLDADKIQAGLLLDFSRALKAVAEVGTFGAKKYTREGWRHVPNSIERYTDAMCRHLIDEKISPTDAESGLHHAAHMAWNALARLELMLSEAQAQAAGQQPKDYIE